MANTVQVILSTDGNDRVIVSADTSTNTAEEVVAYATSAYETLERYLHKRQLGAVENVPPTCQVHGVPMVRVG